MEIRNWCFVLQSTSLEKDIKKLSLDHYLARAFEQFSVNSIYAKD